MKNIQTPISRSIGNQETKIDCQIPESSSGFACTLTLCCRISFISSRVVGRKRLEVTPVLQDTVDVLALDGDGRYLVGCHGVYEIAEATDSNCFLGL